MTVKMSERVREPQAEVVIPAPSAEAREMPTTMIDILMARATNRTRDYLRRQRSQIEIGTQVTGFTMWDCWTRGPYLYDPNVEPPPDFLPNKVIASDQSVWFYGFIWINPSLYGGLNPRDIFANRPYNARFETINRTLVEPGPSHVIPATFPNADAFPVDGLFPLSWEVQFDDPGNTPNIYELDVTIDLTQSGLQYASFGTWNWDPDMDVWGPGPHWEFERSAKFMVYHR